MRRKFERDYKMFRKIKKNNSSKITFMKELFLLKFGYNNISIAI